MIGMTQLGITFFGGDGTNNQLPVKFTEGILNVLLSVAGIVIIQPKHSYQSPGVSPFLTITIAITE